MKAMILARRAAKEILRDPLNLAFGLGFPVVLLALLSAVQARVPVDLFRIERLAPGIAVFGLSFLTLFFATLTARDRESALLQRLYTAPLRPVDFMLGYLAPALPLAAAQCAVCYLAAALLGLAATPSLLAALVLILPAALFFVSFGLLCGSVLTVKQVGGLCGALFTNLAAWFSGAWFDLKLVGGVFQKIANCLPFVHAVELERAALSGDYRAIPLRLAWTLAYALPTLAAASLLFSRQMQTP